MSLQVTAAAHPNLALVKYWGNANDALNLPANSSISVNLDGATTITAVRFAPELDQDTVSIDGEAAAPAARERVVRHLDRVRRLADLDHRAAVASQNDFPASAGIASSASAFAALSLAASRAAGLSLDARQLSVLARKGSGSACRSIPDGFAEWTIGTDDTTSYARQIAPPEHWALQIVTVIFGEASKEVSSSDGHRLAGTSPFFQARLADLPNTLNDVRRALLVRDFRTLGMAVEREAVSMHVVTMTSCLGNCDWLSGIYYWRSETMALIQAIQEWRREGLAVYFTIDAGHNVHLLCEKQYRTDLERTLEGWLPQWDGRYLVSGPGRGAWIIDEKQI